MEGLKTVFVKLGGKKSDLGIPASGAQLSFKVRRPSLSANERKGRSLTGVETAQRGARLSGESWSGGAPATPVPPARPPRGVRASQRTVRVCILGLSRISCSFFKCISFILPPPPTTTTTPNLERSGEKVGIRKLTGQRGGSQQSGTAEHTREDAVLPSVCPSFSQRFV